MFSTMVSLKPPKIGRGKRRRNDQKQENEDEKEEDALSKEAAYDRQMELKGRAVAALRDSNGLPQELVFVTRNMNIVRANNQSLGVPVDRVRILGHYAALGLRAMLADEAASSSRRYSRAHGVCPSRDSLASRLGAVLASQWSYLAFRLALAAVGVAMAANRLWCRVLALATGKPHTALELDSVLDDAMRRAIEKKLGYQIDTSLFIA
ncbi:hypothetical protein H4S06_001896 [Coemansia sp. BCRC 34490]|nr:hypothetical protein H4S06_001896 [Coemansia sp. BCRC 34490]